MPPSGIVGAAMADVVALVLSTTSLAGAQVWIVLSQGTGGRDGCDPFYPGVYKRHCQRRPQAAPRLGGPLA